MISFELSCDKVMIIIMIIIVIPKPKQSVTVYSTPMVTLPW